MEWMVLAAGGVIGVLLDEDVPLLDPVLELLAVLEEGVEHVLVAEALQPGQRLGAVVVPSLGQLLGLKACMFELHLTTWKREDGMYIENLRV